MMQGKQEIAIENLAKIISSDQLSQDGVAWLNERIPFLSEHIDGEVNERGAPIKVYDVEAHIRWIKHWSNKFNCAQNITVTKERADSNNPHIINKTKIILSDLEIRLNESLLEFIEVFDLPLQFSKSSNINTKHVFEIEFQTCIFVSSAAAEGSGYGFQLRNLKSNINLHLTNNKFVNVEFFLAWISSVQMRGNISDGGSTYIVRNIAYSDKADFFHASGNAKFTDEKHSAAKALTRLVNKDIYKKYEEFKSKIQGNGVTNSDLLHFHILQNEIIQLTADDIELEKGSGFVILQDNRFNKLNVHGEIFRFEDGNQANHFVGENAVITYFSPHQNLIKDKEFVMDHWKTFIAQKKSAERRGDNIHAQIFKREITRCDMQIISEQKFANVWQDLAVLWWGQIASNHGISWLRPVVGIFIINSISTFLISYFSCEVEYAKQIAIFIKLLNPIEYSSIINNLQDMRLNAVLAILLIQKTLYFLFLYEIIRVTRRYTR